MTQRLPGKLQKPAILITAVLILLVTLIGAIYAQFTAGSIGFEPENGAPSGQVRFVDSTLAAGGKFVEFYTGSQEDPTYADIPSNFNVNDYLRARTVPASTANEPSGNFRTFCRPSHLEWDDPIVYPNQDKAAHLHQFFGNSAVNESSTYQSLRTTGSSTCEGGPINRTGYWTPAMFDADGSVVPPNNILVYYKGGGLGGAWDGGRQITLTENHDYIRSYNSLPNGLRMIAGAPQGHIEWKCQNEGGGKTNWIQDCPDGEDIYGVVSFPSCWDGENLDSADHRSHMAYRNYNNGWGRYECPSTHPVQLPEITEIFYYTPRSGEDSSRWYLSSDNGARSGTTLHADWFGAWDNAVMERWMNGCLRGMRNGNNGDLCDGQALSGSSGGMGTSRVPGYRPLY